MRCSPLIDLFIILSLLFAQKAIVASPISEKEKTFEWGAGFLSFRGGHYRGSNQSRSWFIPLPYFTYTSKYIEAEPSFVRGTFFKNEWVSLKLSLLAGLNVESETNSARQGMPSLDYTFEAGPMVIFNLWESLNKQFRLTFEFPFRAVNTTDLTYVKPIGFFGVPYLNFKTSPLSSLSNWSFEFSVAGMWASRKYHNHFYGVSPVYALADRPAYDAQSGYSGVQSTIIFNKRYDNFIFIPFFRFDVLEGAVFESSPLIKSKNYFIGGLAFFWLFGDDLTGKSKVRAD